MNPSAASSQRPSSPGRGFVREVLRAVSRVDRSALRPGEAARVALGVAAPLVVGISLGAPLVGATAAAGALSVGFVALQGTYRGRLLATVVASAGMALSTVLGAVVGPYPVAYVLATAALGLGAGLVVCLGVPATVTGIQCVIALLLVGQFDLTVGEAALRGLEVLAGGLGQAVLVVLPWPLRRAPAERAALSRMYRALAGYARLDDARPPHATTTQAAATVLADPQPFARPSDLAGYRDLLAEGERVRASLATLATGRARLPDGPARRAVDEVGAAVGRVLALLATATQDDHAPDEAAVEQALREAGGAATRLRSAAPGYLVRQVEALLGQVRAARRAVERVAEHSHSGIARRDRRPTTTVLVAARTTLTANLGLGSTSFRHALRLSGGLAVAATASTLVDSTHAYWLSLTALVVLRPDFGATVIRGAARTVGTLLGAGLATVVVAVLAPSRPVLAGLSIVVAYLGYLLFAVNYAAYAACITSYIAFLLAFTGLPEASVAADRALFTLGGGAIALLAYLVWPTWESARLPELLATLLRRQGDYLDALLAVHAEPTSGSAEQRRELRGAARLARSNAEASLTRMLAEPHRPDEIDAELGQAVVAAARRVAWSALALHASRPEPSETPGPVGTAELGHALTATLHALADALVTPGPRYPVDTSPLRPRQTALAARFGIGAGDMSNLTDDSVPLLVVETDALVDAVNTLAEAVGRTAVSR